MVEAGASEITEQEMLEAIFFGHDEIKRLVEFNNKLLIISNQLSQSLFQLNAMKR